MSLRTKDFFVKQISHLSNGVVIVTSTSINNVINDIHTNSCARSHSACSSFTVGGALVEPMFTPALQGSGVTNNATVGVGVGAFGPARCASW